MKKRMTYRQIAKVLNIDAATVFRIEQRALAKLRKDPRAWELFKEILDKEER